MFLISSQLVVMVGPKAKPVESHCAISYFLSLTLYCYFRCEEGYYGDPISRQPCEPCLCPDIQGSGRFFATSCHHDPRSLGLTCVCSEGHEGAGYLDPPLYLSACRTDLIRFSFCDSFRTKMWQVQPWLLRQSGIARCRLWAVSLQQQHWPGWPQRLWRRDGRVSTLPPQHHGTALPRMQTWFLWQRSGTGLQRYISGPCVCVHACKCDLLFDRMLVRSSGDGGDSLSSWESLFLQLADRTVPLQEGGCGHPLRRVRGRILEHGRSVGMSALQLWSCKLSVLRLWQGKRTRVPRRPD